MSVAAAPAQAESVPATCGAIPDTGELTVAQVPTGTLTRDCDLTGRTVVHDGMGVAIPARGETVRIEAVGARDAGAHGFSLGVTEQGAVFYELDSPEGVGGAAGTKKQADGNARAAAPAACSDNLLLPWDWEDFDYYEWYIGDGGMPGGLSKANAITAFKDAINNITGGYNDCGIADTIDAGHRYKGATTYEADIGSDGYCTPRDKQSTWDAGNLEAGTLAATCGWTTNRGGSDDLIEADVRYNTTDFNFTNNPTSSCTSHYDLRAVGTHEAGHVFGLDHAPAGHDNLTMTPSIGACDKSLRTLGKGDMRTLEAIY
ncbi:matrixin family metalloprotease [Streptomyces longisporoflavus]|uniref:matrixin family metalloprotease n=1 Tax=Streptomyces longisporoflavus TaxID=28044 RepID=UPI001E50A07A|nr:matrixin family metalloprotease [Streptomyces longisporoflavus]